MTRVCNYHFRNPGRSAVLIIWLFVIGGGCFLMAADQELNLSSARGLVEQGKYDQAAKWLRKAADKPPDQVDKLLLLARCYVGQNEWGDLKSCMKKLELLKPEDLHIPYYLGMAFRESGKFKAFILRDLDWNKSDTYFTHTIETDSSFKDVLYQYALLQKYREKYFDAVVWAEKQRRFHPDDYTAMVGLHRFYDYLLFHESETVAQWLAQRTDLAYGRLYLGDHYRRKGDLPQAEKILTGIIEHPDSTLSVIPAILSLARLHYGNQKGGIGEEYFQYALNKIVTPLDAALVLEDLKYILSDSEWINYKVLSSPAQQKLFFRNVLLSRNPLPALNANPRLTEHYRRLLMAEKHYRYDGFRTWFNSPDKLAYLSFPLVYRLNEKFNDKGLVLLRQGEPDDRAVSLGAEIKQNESWLYHAAETREKMMFHFVIDDNATGNNWRLTALLDKNMLDSRLHWDHVFFKMNNASPLEALQYTSEMGELSRRSVEAGLTTDRHRWSMPITPINFPHSVSTFRGQDLKTRYEVTYGITASQIWPRALTEANQDYITVGCSAFDRNWNTVYHVQRMWKAEDIIRSSNTIGYWADLFAFEAHAEPLHISLFVWNIAGKALGGYRFEYQGRAYLKQTADMSDLMLAYDVRPDTSQSIFNKRGLRIYPQPSFVFGKSRLLYTYFELYDLPLGSSGRFNFEVQYKLNWLGKSDKEAKKNKGRSRKVKTITSSTVQRAVTTTDQAEYLALDMRQKEPGWYELAVQVTSDMPVLKLIRTIEFELR